MGELYELEEKFGVSPGGCGGAFMELSGGFFIWLGGRFIGVPGYLKILKIVFLALLFLGLFHIILACFSRDLAKYGLRMLSLGLYVVIFKVVFGITRGSFLSVGLSFLLFFVSELLLTLVFSIIFDRSNGL